MHGHRRLRLDRRAGPEPEQRLRLPLDKGLKQWTAGKFAARVFPPITLKILLVLSILLCSYDVNFCQSRCHR